MHCHICNASAIIQHPPRCKEHFIEDFEQRVQQTIEDYGLIQENDRILVAASGGKDSLTVLVLLRKWFKDVTAVVVDEGIAGYREHTLEDLRKVCEEHDVKLIVQSFEELSGKTLDGILKEKDYRPCNVCGAFRRHLLNVTSKEFDVIATGHNLDDESQAVLMNLLKGNTAILPRSGPVSGHGAKGFTKRVKPLYFCTEKEVMTYAFLHGLTTKFTECPNVQGSYRDTVRELLNAFENDHPGTKRNIIEQFLTLKAEWGEATPVELQKCEVCNEPCAGTRCKACQYLVEIKA